MFVSARALLTFALLGGLVACGGTGGEVVQNPPKQENPKDPENPVTPAERPFVTDIVTSDGSISNGGTLTGVKRNTVITANVTLTNGGGGVDVATTEDNVVLYRTSDRRPVPIALPGVDGVGQNITVSPQGEGGLLEANTRYTFEIKSGLKDASGNSFKPFKATFTTGEEPRPVQPAVSFAASKVFPQSGYVGAPIASLAMSPYGTSLYGVTLDGKVIRWRVDATTGALSNQEVLNLGDLRPDLAGRAVIGLAFEKPREGEPQVLWITHNAPLFGPPNTVIAADKDPVYVPPDFSGAISKLIIPNNGGFSPAAVEIQDYVVGLPRSLGDHLTNSLAFGPDGMLYVTQSSNTSTGAPDPTWNHLKSQNFPQGIHHERLLNAAVLQVDPSRDVSAGPINVQTESYQHPGGQGQLTTGNYNPFDANAPVKIFADGVRNAYDLVWHSDGSLYLPTNGAASGGYTYGSGSVPALENISTQKDFLFRTSLDPNDRDNYYGHPVRLRGHHVLNGGNPSAGVDPAEVVADGQGRVGYPVGTMPEGNYTRPIFDFGLNRSANGAIEYQSNVFGDKLKGKLLVLEYAGGMDVLALDVDSGTVTSETIGVKLPSIHEEGLTRPLDIAEDTRNGNLYITELVMQPGPNQAPQARIRLLKPTN